VKLSLVFPTERPIETAANAIWIFQRLRHGYAGLDPAGQLTAIYPVEGKLPVVGRGSGSIRIEYRSDVRIQLGEVDELRNCCIVACADRLLERSFAALVEALGNALSSAPNVTAREFGLAFAAWEQLFQKRRRLSTDEEQGLWGELYFLSICPSLERAIACWRGPSAEDYDFVTSGVAFEVKTSRRKGRHQVSHSQVTQATQPNTIFLVSLWVGEDAAEGIALPAVIDLLAERAQDPITFEEKLLATGYSRADKGLYERPLAALESPLLYDMTLVPRVRDMDPGVMSLSYSVQLDAGASMPAKDTQDLLGKVFS
jgi:hypothetical protein